MAKGSKSAPSGEDLLPLGGATPEPGKSDDELLADMLREEEKAKASKEPEPEASNDEASKEPDAEPEPALQGPRVRVWAHGAVHWNGDERAPGEVFVVDTMKHTEAQFLRLVELGALERLD